MVHFNIYIENLCIGSHGTVTVVLICLMCAWFRPEFCHCIEVFQKFTDTVPVHCSRRTLYHLYRILRSRNVHATGSRCPAPGYNMLPRPYFLYRKCWRKITPLGLQLKSICNARVIFLHIFTSLEYFYNAWNLSPNFQSHETFLCFYSLPKYGVSLLACITVVKIIGTFFSCQYFFKLNWFLVINYMLYACEALWNRYRIGNTDHKIIEFVWCRVVVRVCTHKSRDKQRCSDNKMKWRTAFYRKCWLRKHGLGVSEVTK